MEEDYGLRKEEYRKLIEDPHVTATEIARRIKVPAIIYRYRRFGRMKGNNWEETDFWDDDVNGVCMFSKPASFNKNDSDDCKVRFENKTLLDYMGKGMNREQRRAGKKMVNAKLKEYKKSLQQTMRVGCFTAVEPVVCDMWYDLNFGDAGRGFCIEYEVDDENFRPDGLAFLPVLYDDKPYDNTKAMKAIVDLAQANSNKDAASLAVCLGYGHTLIKPQRYKKEKEWRLVIPIRSDGAHKGFFTVDNESKRDMSSAIRAMYLGPNIEDLTNYKKYENAVISFGDKYRIPVYKILKNGSTLEKVKIMRPVEMFTLT